MEAAPLGRTPQSPGSKDPRIRPFRDPYKPKAKPKTRPRTSPKPSSPTKPRSPTTRPNARPPRFRPSITATSADDYIQWIRRAKIITKVSFLSLTVDTAATYVATKFDQWSGYSEVVADIWFLAVHPQSPTNDPIYKRLLEKDLTEYLPKIEAAGKKEGSKKSCKTDESKRKKKRNSKPVKEALEAALLDDTKRPLTGPESLIIYRWLNEVTSGASTIRKKEISEALETLLSSSTTSSADQRTQDFRPKKIRITKKATDELFNIANRTLSTCKKLAIYTEEAKKIRLSNAALKAQVTALEKKRCANRNATAEEDKLKDLKESLTKLNEEALTKLNQHLASKKDKSAKAIDVVPYAPFVRIGRKNTGNH